MIQGGARWWIVGVVASTVLAGCTAAPAGPGASSGSDSTVTPGTPATNGTPADSTPATPGTPGTTTPRTTPSPLPTVLPPAPAWAAPPTDFTVPTDSPYVLDGVRNVTQVGQITGAEGPGDTTQWGVGFCDLGSMFEANGKVYFTFGDTFAAREPGATGGGGTGWRSNVMGWTTDANPADGITIAGMIVDDKGIAKELLPSKKTDFLEMTVIPTYGFEANGALYLHWMSVKHWGPKGGEWVVNDAGLSKSTDEGHTWTKLDAPRWDGKSGFVQIAPAHVVENGVDTLYVWGITHGRFAGVSLAKVPTAAVEDPAAWQYYTGTDSAGAPQWGNDYHAAAIVIDDTVGELSVMWSPYLDRWIMTYLREGTGIVMREGLTPWGPWGKAITVVRASDVPGPYAPYMLPRYTEANGATIYFTLSIWEPYEVFWYRADLKKAG